MSTVDEFSIAAHRDRFFAEPEQAECCDCGKPCEPEIELTDDTGEPTGEYVCRACDADWAGKEKRGELVSQILAVERAIGHEPDFLEAFEEFQKARERE